MRLKDAELVYENESYIIYIYKGYRKRYSVKEKISLLFAARFACGVGISYE